MITSDVEYVELKSGFCCLCGKNLLASECTHIECVSPLESLACPTHSRDEWRAFCDRETSAFCSVCGDRMSIPGTHPTAFMFELHAHPGEGIVY